jgi:hypothetical protein
MKEKDGQFIPTGIQIIKAQECEFCTSYEDTLQCPTCYDLMWETTVNSVKAREDYRKNEGEERPFDTGDSRFLPPITWLTDRPTEDEKLGFDFALLDDSVQASREVICRYCHIATPKAYPMCQSCDRSLECNVSISLHNEITRIFNIV